MPRRNRFGARLTIAIAALVVALGPMACRRDARPNPHTTTAKTVALRTTTVPVNGMICQVCAGTVKNALKKVDGVQTAEISLEKRTAVIQYDEHRVTADRLARAIQEAGFKPGTPETTQSR